MDNSSKNLHCLPIERSFEVTRGHHPSFANNFWAKRDRDVGLVSVRSSWPGESTDMQYDPFWSSRGLGLAWPEVKLWPWPFKVILYMVRRALTRQTRWYQIRCSTFKIKDFIVEKPFWKILEFWPLVTSILTWAKKWPKWFRNDLSRAFERCLSFFSTMTRSRDHGGRSNAPPPPPAGGGKSRGPAGRGLSALLRSHYAICRTLEIGWTLSRMCALPLKLGGKRCTYHICKNCFIGKLGPQCLVISS